ncbi:hypothetical protein JCM11641_003912, partial [Rhodosporidiobolus odoratus]
MQKLVDRYGSLIATISFTWTYAKGALSSSGRWVPAYKIDKLLSVEKEVERWRRGLDGRISLMQLEDGWKTEWRTKAKNGTTASHYHRIKFVVALVE